MFFFSGMNRVLEWSPIGIKRRIPITHKCVFFFFFSLVFKIDNKNRIRETKKKTKSKIVKIHLLNVWQWIYCFWLWMPCSGCFFFVKFISCCCSAEAIGHTHTYTMNHHTTQYTLTRNNILNKRPKLKPVNWIRFTHFKCTAGAVTVQCVCERESILNSIISS